MVLIHVFFGAQRKIGHLLDGSPDTKNSSYPDWLGSGCYIIIWLLNSMEVRVNSVVSS